jgi:hypothetical protein
VTPHRECRATAGDHVLRLCSELALDERELAEGMMGIVARVCTADRARAIYEPSTSLR